MRSDASTSTRDLRDPPHVPRFRVTPDTILEDGPSAEERIARTPRSYTIKGLYLARHVRALGLPWSELGAMLDAPPPEGHYHAFGDYPQADHARLAVLAARKQFPSVPLREALRRLERTVAQVFADSSMGRMLGGLVTDPKTAFRLFPAAYRLAQHGGAVRTIERPRGVRLELRAFAPWLDCSLVGTIEGTVVLFGRRPLIEVDMLSDTDADYDIEWT